MDQKVKIRNLTLEAFSIYAGLNDNSFVAGAILRQENFSIKQLDLDSLSLMEVSMHLEDGLGIELDVDELQACDTLNCLVDYLAAATIGND